MSVVATWRAAKFRTNVVRAVGYVVGLVLGLPLAFAMLAVLVNGITQVFSDPLEGLFMVAWSVAALGGYGHALGALQSMPRLDERERRHTIWWTLAACVAASPLAIMPPPVLWLGLALVGAGLLLIAELIVEDAEDERPKRRADDAARPAEAATDVGRA